MGRGLTDLGDRVRFLARPEVVPENHPIPLNTGGGGGGRASSTKGGGAWHSHHWGWLVVEGDDGPQGPLGMARDVAPVY